MPAPHFYPKYRHQQRINCPIIMRNAPIIRSSIPKQTRGRIQPSIALVNDFQKIRQTALPLRVAR